ncbi:MAG: hypothetical protein LBR00_00415 [Clostridiales Family XIII bacterium]|jgi:GH25 family lysozyme M1 (1,4-beta-N-acetylmuramidase)|nr:hypothetical protein [Clostridiales Family XIII bacterium]
MRSRILLLILLLAALLICAFGVRVYNGHLFFFDWPDRSGWTGEGAERRYLDRHAGVVTDTMLTVGGDTYYFEADGAVHTGALTRDGFAYWFDEQTGAMRTGWVERDGRRYYYEEGSGHGVIGREVTIDGGDFLFDAEGAEFLGAIAIGGQEYFFEPLTGKLKDAEKQVDGAWWYYTADGSKFPAGWLTLPDGRTCFYDGAAGMLFGEQTIDGQPYLLDISLGRMMTGTVYYDGRVFDIGEDGVVRDAEKGTVWNGVDVSWHQGPDIDWAAVKAAGVQFALIRAGWIASEDRPVWAPDEYFAQNVHGAQAAGISVGAYIYLYNSTEEGLAEGIDAFAADAEALRVKLDLPVFLDVEDKEYFKPKSDTAGEASGVGGYAYRTALVRTCLEQLRALGYDAGFYTFANWADQEFGASALYEEGYAFWLARWYNNDSDPDPATLAWGDDKQPSVWQYRATGIVDGIAKEVDRDYLYWGRMP